MTRSHAVSVGTGNGLDRRQFLVGAAGVGLGVAGAGLVPTVASAEEVSASFGGFPQFNWTTVPTAVGSGNVFRTWSADEARFVAEHSSLVSLGVGHGSESDPHGWTEPGFLHDASQINSFHRPTKVLFPWSATIFRDIYRSTQDFRDDWLLPPDAVGRRFFDLSNPDVRHWIADTLAAVAAEKNVDGVFIDTLATHGRRVFGEEVAVSLLEDIRAGLDALPGTPRLLIYNAQLTPLTNDQGQFDPLLEIADGTMIELFDYQPAGFITTPEEQKRWMLDMSKAAKAGKIVWFKGWPSFSFLTDFGRNAPYEEKVARARAEITFPLAAFLAAAQRHCYLQYSWGWNRNGGQLDNGGIIHVRGHHPREIVPVDPTWYPELLRPLGAPLADAEVDGFVFTRSFAHADVWIDLNAHQAHIDWK